jgi:hypothetical protein
VQSAIEMKDRIHVLDLDMFSEYDLDVFYLLVFATKERPAVMECLYHFLPVVLEYYR